MDFEIIGIFIRKIYWVIIVEECMKIGGIVVELIVLINERLFDELDVFVLWLFF